VERICNEAGVSFPTFKSHYKDKEQVFLATFDETFRRGRLRVAEALEDAGPDWAARVAATLAAVLKGIREEPASARVCLVEALTAGPVGIERYEEGVRLCAPGLQEDRGALHDPAAPASLLEETVVGGVAWVLHQEVAAGNSDDIEQLFKGLLEAVLAPYLGDRKAKSTARKHAKAFGRS